jgi:hypothetical protein
MWDFEHQPTAELTGNFEISYTVPSQCALALQRGTADIGIVPVITCATIPGLVVIPRVTIGGADASSADKIFRGQAAARFDAAGAETDAGAMRCGVDHRRSGVADQEQWPLLV